MSINLAARFPAFVAFEGTKEDLDALAAELTGQSVVFQRKEQEITIDFNAQEENSEAMAYALDLADAYMPEDY